MALVLDHVFVGCAVGAPEADALVQLGLVEGPPNSHPGQGTACRRFYFGNAYLELWWVSDPREATTPPVGRTRLFDRWSSREAGACPFGIVLRASRGVSSPPFPTWTYAPAYVPAGTGIEVGEGIPLTQPAVFWLPSEVRPSSGETAAFPRAHRIQIRDLTDVSVILPDHGRLAEPLRVIAAAGVARFEHGEQYLLRLGFDEEPSGQVADLRPQLPVALCW